MTSKVTIEAVNTDVHVSEVDRYENHELAETVYIIPKGETREFYCTTTRTISCVDVEPAPSAPVAQPIVGEHIELAPLQETVEEHLDAGT